MSAGSPVLGPMEDTARLIGHRIAGALDEHAAENPESPRVGFVLMMFTFGDADDPDQWMTYLSNAERADIVEAMREFIDKQEAAAP